MRLMATSFCALFLLLAHVPAVGAEGVPDKCPFKGENGTGMGICGDCVGWSSWNRGGGGYEECYGFHYADCIGYYAGKGDFEEPLCTVPI